jgi:hypothetical protein
LQEGHVAQRPPITYVPLTSVLTTSTLAELIKVKLNTAGDLIRLENFEDGDNQKNLNHLMTLQQLMATKDVEEKLLLATSKLGEKNKHEAKELHLLEISKAESQVRGRCCI